MISGLEKIIKLYKKNRKRNFKILVFLVLSISIFFRIWWGMQKQGLHLDEVLSVMAANYNTNDAGIIHDQFYAGKELKNKIFINDPSFRDAILDIKTLYISNYDTPHTNFYYSLLRLSFIGRMAVDIKDIIYTGIILNCLFFIIEFFFLFKLLKLLFEKREDLILTALFCIGTAGSSLSNTLFLRPYQLQAMMFVIFSYYLFDTIINKKYNLKRVMSLSFITAFTLLSGYFSIIFIGLNIVAVGVYLFTIKNIKNILYIVLSMILGSFLAQLLYLKYWQTVLFGEDRAGEAYAKLNSSYFFSNIIKVSDTLYEFLSNYTVYFLPVFLIILILGIICQNRKMKEVEIIRLILVFVSGLFSFVAIWLAPIKVIRYIIPALPLFMILIPSSIYFIKNRNYKILLIFFTIFFYFINAFEVNKINYLFESKKTEHVFLGNTKEPVYLLSNADYRFLEWIPYGYNKQRYIFFDNLNNLDTTFAKNNKKRAYLVLDGMLNKDQTDQFLIKLMERYNIEEEIITPADDVVGFKVLKLNIK